MFIQLFITCHCINFLKFKTPERWLCNCCKDVKLNERNKKKGKENLPSTKQQTYKVSSQWRSNLTLKESDVTQEWHCPHSQSWPCVDLQRRTAPCACERERRVYFHWLYSFPGSSTRLPLNQICYLLDIWWTSLAHQQAVGLVALH